MAQLGGVIVTSAESSRHPPAEALITTVPARIGCTVPVESTVAMVLSEELQDTFRTATGSPLRSDPWS